MLEKYFKGLLSWLWAPWIWLRANMQRKEAELKRLEKKGRRNKRIHISKPISVR